MLNLPIEPGNLYLLLGLHSIIGVTAAIIAQKKGLNFPLWLILGLIGGTVALVAALLKKDN